MIPRTDQQRKYFHAVVLPAVAQGLGRDIGRRVDVDVAKEIIRGQLLMRPLVNQDTGEVIGEEAVSTESLSKMEYSALIDDSIKLCATWFGIQVPPP